MESGRPNVELDLFWRNYNYVLHKMQKFQTNIGLIYSTVLVKYNLILQLKDYLLIY